MTSVKYKEKILQDALPLHIRELENNSGGQIPIVVETTILLECAEKFEACFCSVDHSQSLAALVASFFHT